MLSLGEVHNMSLNGRGGFRLSGDLNGYDRGSYGLSTTVLDGLAAGNAGGLQHNLSDFLHQNPFLHAGLPQADAVTSSSLGAYSMGFPGTHAESLLFDVEVMSHVDDHLNFPAGIVTTTAVAPGFDPIPCLGLGVPSVLHSAGRESWVDAAALGSARGVKREGPVMDPANMHPRKKVETTARVVVGLDKCKRPSDQADHILRERQRRDDMTSKFSVLESLLPSGPKRDRSTIVDDSIEYVKNLHHRIKLLQKRKEELAQASANPNAGGLTSNGTTRWKWSEAEVLQQQQQPQPRLASPKKPKAKTPKLLVSQEEMNRIRLSLRTSLESMQVHTDMPNQVVINMVCRPQPRLQSNILQCLESLDLDVMQCSITKVSHRIICVITAKPQEATTPTSGIVAALKFAMGSDTQTR